MLYYLTLQLQEMLGAAGYADQFSFLRVMRYITVRSAGAAVTALLLSWWFGPLVIRWLRDLRFGQEYADKAEESSVHATPRSAKRGTPTMGGILIIASLDLSALLWAQWNELVLLTLLSLMVLAGLGFYDDYAKIARQDSRGTTSKIKLGVQITLALAIGIYLLWLPATRSLVSEIAVPFYKYPIATNVAWAGLLLLVATIVGSSNAVNLTDGMDGLAIGCTIIVTGVFIVLTYIAGNTNLAGYLQVPYVAGAGELTVISSAMFGAGLGFLWFNCHPAQVFMGDTGSLALGGALGIMAVLIHQPFVLLIAGGVFVAEAISVISQTTYFKYTRRRYGTGRRIFLMSPLHHHFEQKGWHESQVVARFYILGILCAVVALSTLKLR